MLEFFRFLGIVISVVSFGMAVFVFFRLNVPSAVAYFFGNENKRLKEYQKRQRDELSSSGNKKLPKAKVTPMQRVYADTGTMPMQGSYADTGTMPMQGSYADTGTMPM